MPSIVSKLVLPQLCVHVIPLVPLRSGIDDDEGSMSVLAASRASINEIKDGRVDHPEYPVAHTSQEGDADEDVKYPMSHVIQDSPFPAAEYLPAGHALHDDTDEPLTSVL